MNDKNLYTKLLFSAGLIALAHAVWYLAVQKTFPLPFLLLLVTTVVFEQFPLQWPNKMVYTLSSAALTYCLIRYGFGAGSLTLCLAASSYFVKKLVVHKKFFYYRYLSSTGMYYLSAIASYFVYQWTKDFFPSFLSVLFTIFAFETCNLLLLRLIWKSILKEDFVVFGKSVLKQVAQMSFPILISTLVVERFYFVSDENELLVDVGYTFGFLILISFFSSAYFKQIQKVEESQQRYQSLYDQNPDLVIILKPDGTINSANPRLQETFYLEPDKIVGQSFYDIIPQHRELIENHMQRALEGNPGKFSLSYKSNEGREFEFVLSLVPIFVQKKVIGIYVIAKDITDLLETKREVQRLAYFDTVTGLPNRVTFQDRLDHSLLAVRDNDPSGPSLGVLFIDMDNFKDVNDTMGHDVGDALLREAAERLIDCVGRNGLTSRFGGDEFAILVPEAQGERAIRELGERILEAFRRPFKLDGRDQFISLSIGISLAPLHGTQSNELIRFADVAMYAAKEEGGGRVRQYRQELHEKREQRVRMQALLHRALERNELYVTYQPKLDLGTGKIYGAEALIRWNSAELGFVSPAEFIPLAEDNGSIVPIGDWVLQEACRQNKRWQDLGYPPLSISVNVSSVQFQGDDLVPKVKHALDISGLDPKWLELEITETVLLNNTNRTLAILTELKAIGVKISLDDFGVGYSSLSYLNRFTIDYLKIDRSFIENVGVSPRDESIIKAIVQMARNLEIKVIAEGVETEPQLRYLKELDCYGVQGFLVSKPLETEAFMETVLPRIQWFESDEASKN